MPPARLIRALGAWHLPQSRHNLAVGDAPMLKTVTVNSFVLATALLLTGPRTSAQTRIHFAKGRTSATVSGSVARNGSKCFLLGTRQGQSLEGRLRSRSGNVQFPWHSGAGSYKGGTRYSKVTDGGDEEVCIENTGGATTFTLTVSVR